MHYTRAAVLAALTTAVLAGCSNSVPTTNDTRPERVPTANQDQTDSQVESDVVAAYMNVLEEKDPDALLAGRKNALKDSVADAYILHLAYLAEGQLDAGMGTHAAPGRIERKEDNYQLCSYDNLTGDERCITYSDFKVKDGKLTDFLIDRKSPGSLMVMGSGETVSGGGVKLEFLSAYRSIQSNTLYITARATSGSKPVQLDVWSATYRASNGKQRTVSDSVAPDKLEKNSSVVIIAGFRGVSPGGRLTVEACSDEFCERSTTLTLNLDGSN